MTVKVRNDSPNVGMGVEHGAHERGSGAGHAADEDERHLAIVLVDLAVAADHEAVGAEHGGAEGVRVAEDAQPDEEDGHEEQQAAVEDGPPRTAASHAQNHRLSRAGVTARRDFRPPEAALPSASSPENVLKRRGFG